MAERKRIKYGALLTALCILLLMAGCGNVPRESALPTAPVVTEAPETTEATQPEPVWEIGYIATLELTAEYYGTDGSFLGTLVRGAEVAHTTTPDGETQIQVNGVTARLQEGAYIVSQLGDVIPEHTLYVRSAVNLRDIEGRLLTAFAQKGAAVEVNGCDYLQEDGTPHMYRVRLGEEIGYIMPWYLADSQEAALVNYDDNGSYEIHAGRSNRYGGGGADNLDYFPREKQPIEGNPIPEECRTLYIASWCVEQVDAYLEIAEACEINAFVVDIADGTAVGYAGNVMQEYCPSGVGLANNTVEEYQAAIQKLKDAGYYVIGRITTFNDTSFIKDHPECAITDTEGNPLKLAGEYWPTAYNRTAWQYKVDLAVEAVEIMGFHEIQFDYVRFPDNTWRYEDNGTIDFHNTYAETKAQAIQRFLMYATDIIHEHGAYVSADVYGESAYNYVTAYGQYWPAISNVVDVISGMPYPDHFAAAGDWLPWENPYDTLYSWGKSAMYRQEETATPAVIRTWIQAYNAIHEPYTTYGPEQIDAQVRALRDAGCTGGYMTWNAASSVAKYKYLQSAFALPKED